MVHRNYTKRRKMLATMVWCSFSSELCSEISCWGVIGWFQGIRAPARPLWCTCQVHILLCLLSARLFTARRGTAPTGYPCTQELKSAAPSVSMKGITLYQPRIVHARFMIEISWKESSVFWKWFRYYIFPLWREEISSFLVISSWAWHRKRVSTPMFTRFTLSHGTDCKIFLTNQINFDQSK